MAFTPPDGVAKILKHIEGAIGLDFLASNDEPTTDSIWEKLFSTQGQLHLEGESIEGREGGMEGGSPY